MVSKKRNQQTSLYESLKCIPLKVHLETQHGAHGLILELPLFSTIKKIYENILVVFLKLYVHFQMTIDISWFCCNI